MSLLLHLLNIAFIDVLLHQFYTRPRARTRARTRARPRPRARKRFFPSTLQPTTKTATKYAILPPTETIIIDTRGYICLMLFLCNLYMHPLEHTFPPWGAEGFLSL